MVTKTSVRLLVGAICLAFLPTTIIAQQNFFNVPSSEITEHGKTFFQQQFNFFSGSTVSNSTFCFGVGSDAEIGVNLLGVTYDHATHSLVVSAPDSQPVYPSLGLNAQKQVGLTDHFELSAGGQLLFPRQPHLYEWYGYVNGRLHYEGLKCILGIFGGNDNYFDNESRFDLQHRSLGLQAGIELELLNDRLYLQSDFITGRTALSNLIVGFAYKITPAYILSAGYQFPNNVATSSRGLIFEITYVEQ